MSRRPMHLPIWFFFCSVLCAAIYPSAEPIAAGLPPSWLTQEEKNWLADHPVIRLAPDPGFPPIEFLDDAGNYRGIASDYVALIEEKLGISFSVVPFQRWDEILAAASNKKVDMLGAAAESEERSEYLAFTRPYLELPGHIITRKETKGTITLNQLNAKKVAVVAGYIWQGFLKRDFPAIRLEPVDDVPTGLNKVSYGTVDAMVANLAVAMYYIHQNGLTNLRVAGAVDHVARYAFATRKDWPILNRILEKALLRIGPDERTAILAKWIATEQAGEGSRAASGTTLSSDMPSVQEIMASIASLEKNSDLAAATRDKALELYRLALSRIQAAEQTEQKAAEYRESMTSAPVETERIRKELELDITLKETGVDAIPAGVTCAQLKQRLSQAEAELGRLQKARAELADQIKAQQGRPGKIQDELSETKLAIDRIDWRLAASPPLSGEDLLSTEAEHLALKAQRRVNNAKAHLLEQELLSYDVRLELLIAEFNQTQVRQGRVESQVKRLQERANQLLAEEAETAQQSARQDLQEVFGKNPVVQEAAEKNTKLSQQLSELAVKIEAVTHRRETVEGLLSEFNRDLRSIEQQLEIAGHSPALAEVLISERRKLPNLRIYDRDARERRNQIASARLQEFQLNEQQQRLRTTEQELNQLLEEKLSPELTPEQQGELRARLAQMLNDRKALLRKLSGAYGNYAKQLTTFDLAERNLAKTVQKLEAVLNERLLWVPSTTPVGIEWLKQGRRAAEWSLAKKNWTQAGWDLMGELLKAPFLVFSLLFVFTISLWAGRRMRYRAQTISAYVGNPSLDRFTLTLEAVVFIVLRAAPWPLLLGFLAWLLRRSIDVTHFAAAVGHGLTALAVMIFFLEFYRRVCEDKGLAEVHFHWSRQACRVLYRNIGWLRFCVYPASFLLGVTELQPTELIDDAPGRPVFLLRLLVVAVFFVQVAHPHRGVFGTSLSKHRPSWLWRLRYLWYPVVVGWPLSLMILVLFGYFYTATSVFKQMEYSLWLILGAVLFYHMLLRWAAIAVQRVALAHAKAERQAAWEAKAAQTAGETSGEGVPESLVLSEFSAGEISEQTRTLLRVVSAVALGISLWVTWAGFAPALGLLNQITLWQSSMDVEGVRQLEPVTLWDLSLAIVVSALTWITVRNLPGFMSISLLRRFSLDRGTEYAITTVSRYASIAAGIVIVSNLLGIAWSKVQWLLAGLTVGLGFGLQEIFANFISGLIILFERPIRIGDTVTVGTNSGTVTRIRTRATTITDWDHKELIIPNKSFVTGEVVNWTLSDPITRLIIRVGVAYGSDVELTEKLMLDVATTHALVLDDPPPTVFFRGFDESALTFELRVFFKDILNRMQLTHELNKAINQAFSERGIEIAFPQRDIHVRSIDTGVGRQPIDHSDFEYSRDQTDKWVRTRKP